MKRRVTGEVCRTLLADLQIGAAPAKFSAGSNTRETRNSSICLSAQGECNLTVRCPSESYRDIAIRILHSTLLHRWPIGRTAEVSAGGPWGGLSMAAENRTLIAGQNRTLGTRGDEPHVVTFSFDLPLFRVGDEAEAEPPWLRVRQSSVCWRMRYEFPRILMMWQW